ncbi:ABC1 kinase family protein [Marinilactibacillus psychrotolerans]|uniref:AarF/ABC1/UbiB kinase family protein n=2 Tax=Marinilactibacillus psychrotolerans TaxID=191770 RepID=A0A5R9C194_9LACT|nr:AarF/UbiB family protein [Marinilactibacillus psychrotolerans]TLQ06466.1 AarF/ABC1/UbiB kinase family protein [Marinilactibacillus psychrotolerans]SJN40774.1 Ubiquinone biosynthesis monooxygenase UbiB [Marinilactibacillus psychrotolerans 42ea]
MVKTNRERLKEIASVLASYGFGHIYNTRIRSRNKEQDAKNLRKAFEELGPSFIKIGQIISTRRDLLPSNYIQELSKLRDDAPPFSYNEMRRIFEKDLGLSFEEVFLYVDEKPLASASVAQVHKAKLKSGENVIIKVQRPEIEENLLRDIRLFSRIVSMAPNTVKEMLVDAESAFKEMLETTKIELDFRNEAKYLVRFRELNKSARAVTAPKPYLTLTSKRVLVEEYIDGIKGLNPSKIISAGYEKQDIAEKLVYSFLSQVFNDGFFHGDPHQGNLMIKDQQIVFLDFGITGELSSNVRESLVKLVNALVLEDIESMMNILLQMAIVKTKVNRFALNEDLSDFYHTYVSRSFKNIDLSTFFSDVLYITHKHKMIMPNDFLLLAKSLTILEGVITELYPEINVLQIATSYIKENDSISFFDSFSKDKLMIGLYQFTQNSVSIPLKLTKALDTINNGRVKIHLDLVDGDIKWTGLNKMVNRIVFAVIIAALILASAVILAVAEGTGVSLLAIVIFIGAGIMGLWLLISIIRSGTL